ncbi:class I SAM-dependent methyltransferase [Crenobacter caeni]|uniref:Class I SAM-dependent methyltransferase n=1 Tax=Crenobacter caeni TaxID=2705474 RepID=A0A6B2KR00_9NEIS|nr:class I SAM-dependent methyltransferase [Crenobacter caeni]NDV12554.1 class I SAM-dependent methyltransferase [Crenobacter caeni]
MLRAALAVFLASLAAWALFAPLAEPGRWALAQAAFCLLLGRALSLGGVRLIALGLFAPALLLALQWSLPPWVWALAALLTFALARNAPTQRVPFYRSSGEVCRVLSHWLPQGARLCDLGCADARMLFSLARLRPDLVLTGVENAPLPWLAARVRWSLAGRPANVKIVFGDLRRLPLAGFDVLYAFLSPAPMPMLWRRFQREADAGAWLASNSFAVPDAPAERTLPLGGPLQTELLLWRRPHAT